jgi:hypothetical protein
MGYTTMKSFIEIKEELAELNEEAVLYDGYEDALIGIAFRFNLPPLACYDYNKCILLLMNRDGMTHEEAVDYFQYNTLGCWAGDHTPIFVNMV